LSDRQVALPNTWRNLVPDPNRKRNWWTMAEEKILREIFPKQGLAAAVAALPNHPESGIYWKARKLGLKPPAPDGFQPVYHTTPQIDELIKRELPKLTGKGKSTMRALCARLDRPEKWVAKRARQLGLFVPPRSQPAWTAEEDEYLETLAHLSLQQIRTHLRLRQFPKRSTGAISKRLHHLEIDKREAREASGYLSGAGVARMLGVTPTAVQKWVRRGELPAKRHGARKNDGKAAGSTPYEIKPADLREFVFRHPLKIDLRKLELEGDKVWFFALLENLNNVD
jgi:hypothetical protein